MVRSFGAPVIEPGGKAARTASTPVDSASRVAVTVLTSWWTVA